MDSSQHSSATTHSSHVPAFDSQQPNNLGGGEGIWGYSVYELDTDSEMIDMAGKEAAGFDDQVLQKEGNQGEEEGDVELSNDEDESSSGPKTVASNERKLPPIRINLKRTITVRKPISISQPRKSLKDPKERSVSSPPLPNVVVEKPTAAATAAPASTEEPTTIIQVKRSGRKSRRRIFVGVVQDCWGFKKPKIKQLEAEPYPKRSYNSTPRYYIGKKKYLFYPVLE